MRVAGILLMMWPLMALAGEDKVPVEVKESEAPERCEVYMNIGWYDKQDVTLKPGRVVGPDFNLHIEDNVVYGFIRGKTTRFKVKGDHIHGSALGSELMLHVSKSEETTEIRGLVGRVRVLAVITPVKIKINSMGRTLLLVRKENNYFRGHVGSGASLQFADLTIKGCEFSMIKNRPDLIVVLFMCWLGG
jgi:hypothetical protein